MARLIVLAPLLALANPAAAAVLGGDAAACTSRSGPAIEVTVTGLKDRIGDLKLEMYPATEADFLKDDHDLIAQSKFFRRVRAATPPGSAPVVMCIRAPKPGRYALLFTHNRDGKNKFNFWVDGAGLPSNRSLGRARPKLVQATIDVGPGITDITIRAQYLHGLIPSFGPVGG